MESVIIEEMRAFLRLDLPDRQRQYFTDTIAVAKRVEVVKAADVFDERDIMAKYTDFVIVRRKWRWKR